MSEEIELPSAPTTNPKHKAPANQDPAIDKVYSLLYRRFYVTLVSDRKIEGDFQCLDKQGNLILGNSVEKTPDAQGKVDERLLGMVLIPKAQQKDVQIEVSTDEQLSLLDLGK